MEENPMPNQEPNIPQPIIPPVTEIRTQSLTPQATAQILQTQGGIVSPIKPSDKGRKKRLIVVIFTAALLMIIGLTVYRFVSSKLPQLKNTAKKIVSLNNKTSEEGDEPMPTEAPLPTPKLVEGTEGWFDYKKEGAMFTFKYPPDISINEVNPGFVKIRKNGPSQEGNEEFIDGIVLWFRSLDAGSLTLKQAADKTYLDIKAFTDVSFPIVGSLGGVVGYTFHVKESVGLDYYYLPMGESLYLEVINGTKDPTSQGFISTADKILATLTVGI